MDRGREEVEGLLYSMNHVEGGWPKDVKTELIEHKNKFIRKTIKEDLFKYDIVT